jgi:hypothetical protein
MSEIKTRTFGHTAAALIVFESTVAQRARAWETAASVEDVDAAELADINALRPVQEAFHRDTSDINSLESCMRMDLASLRKLAQASVPAAPITGANEVAQAPDDADGADDTDAPSPR